MAMALVLLSPAMTQAFEVKVVEVVDGDTIRLASGDRVRYLGIDTPEARIRVNGQWVDRPQPYAEAATAYNRALVEGKTVRMELDPSEFTDRYGRLLAYVFVGDLFVNEKMLERGLAKVYFIGPHRQYRDLFEKAAEEARRHRRGIWSKED